eukprot:5953112-Pyramimonas_sp.AAC.2
MDMDTQERAVKVGARNQGASQRYEYWARHVVQACKPSLAGNPNFSCRCPGGAFSSVRTSGP